MSIPMNKWWGPTGPLKSLQPAFQVLSEDARDVNAAIVHGARQGGGQRVVAGTETGNKRGEPNHKPH